MLLSPSQYRLQARESLDRAHKTGQVILLHTGLIVLLTLLLTLADHLLELQIATTGGLGGLSTRAVLSTTQYILQLLPLVLLPFWQVGYTYYTLRVARGEPADKKDLLAGFRRCGPILRLKLLTVLLLAGAAIACSYVASFIFAATPWAAPLMEQMEQLLLQEDLTEAAMMEAMMAISQDSAVPLMIIFCICFLAAGLFLFYRIRLAEFWLMDHSGKSALAALVCSHKLMRGNCKRMLKIDLSFWWFFLLEILVSALGMGDVILDAFGITLSSDAFVSYLIFFCLYLWAQLMLYWWKKNEVSVTYAHAYITLCTEVEEAAKM